MGTDVLATWDLNRHSYLSLMTISEIDIIGVSLHTPISMTSILVCGVLHNRATQFCSLGLRMNSAFYKGLEGPSADAPVHFVQSG